MIIHPIKPVFDKDSKVLILGSFPSVKSREEGFFYGHPRNRFWKVTAAVTGDELPLTTEDKKAFLIRNHIALWDVIGSCDIEGSSDSSIRNVSVNDITPILEKADIREIFFERTEGISALQEIYVPGDKKGRHMPSLYKSCKCCPGPR